MLKKERQAFILHRLNLHNKVLSMDLCQEIGVSEDTIRRDLQELSKAGRLIKVHGGALSMAFNEVQFAPVNVYSQTQKTIIAQKAIQLLKNNMYVLTSGGTTILELIRNLPVELKATFMTGSIPVVNACMAHPNIDVVVVGDKLSKDSKITVGGDAIEQISRINADLCFLGTNAIDVIHGITDNDREVVRVKKAMVETSTVVACMTIAEKLETYQPVQVCPLKKINYLITELDPGDEKLRPFIDAGITVL
ncbi:MAG: DeoR/GlpR family DNA-binding transcription regulator [Niabella sp.]